MRAAAGVLIALSMTAVPARPAPVGPGAAEVSWPQWLGPARNGAVDAPGTFTGRASPALRVAWRKPAGNGTAGLAVADGRVITVASDGTTDQVVALSVADGSEQWRVALEPSLPALERGPVSTPAVGGGLVHVLSSACRLRALDAATGRTLWSRDLKADFGVDLRQGCQTSPLLEGAQVLVQGGGRENDRSLLAFDARSGEPAWTARGAQRTFYTSPVVAELAGTRQVVVHHTVPGPPPISGLVGLRLSDRAVLWERTLERNMSFETPVFLPPDRVLLLTWNDAHAFRVVSRDGALHAEPAWETQDVTADVSPPVVHGGHLYGFGGDFLSCLDTATGRAAWKEKLYRGSLILVDGHLVVLSVTSGMLRVVEATPAGYREKARLEVLNRGSRAETPPSFAGRRIFVRNDEEIVAVDVG
jgi:outer membrane protein assembly factor BamB